MQGPIFGGVLALCELVGLNIGSTMDVKNVTAEGCIRDLGTGFGNGMSCAADEITAKKGKWGADSRVVMFCL